MDYPLFRRDCQLLCEQVACQFMFFISPQVKSHVGTVSVRKGDGKGSGKLVVLDAGKVSVSPTAPSSPQQDTTKRRQCMSFNYSSLPKIKCMCADGDKASVHLQR